MVRLTANARWNGLSAYLIYDFSGQLSLRICGEIFKGSGEANTCVKFQIGTRCRRNFPTRMESTSMLQYKPFPSLITRAEYRHAKSYKNVFLSGSRPANHQETLPCQVDYIFAKDETRRAQFTCPSSPVATKAPAHSAACPSNGPRQTTRR